MFIRNEVTLTQAVLQQIEDGKGSSPALFSDKETITYEQLNDRGGRLSNFLKDRGLERGDCVGVLLYKSPLIAETFLACSMTGAIYVPINFKLNIDRIRFQIAHIPIRFLIVEKEFESILSFVIDLFPDRRKVITVGWSRADLSNLEEYHKYPSRFEPVLAGMDDILYLNYTSGTTGIPKGAVTTHRNLFYNTLSCNEFLGMKSDDIFLCLFSVFAHPHELFYRSIFTGGAAVLFESLSPRTIAEVIERFRVSWVMAVPSFYQMMSEKVGRDEVDLSSLRILESGGAMIMNSTLETLEERFGVTMIPVWGSTETTGVSLALTPEMKKKSGSIGFPLPFYDVSVVLEDGREAERGEIGEMVVSGPAVVDGYWKMPEETSSYFRDSAFWTGDHVRRDDEGYFYFINRKSEMMKIGGIRVYPSEIENVLIRHPGVKEVVVIGAGERLRGEIARAIVVRSNYNGGETTASELKRFCREHLALYQVPRIIEFWDELPKTPVGKVDKKKIKEIIESKKNE